jgi:hypothetical protein
MCPLCLLAGLCMVYGAVVKPRFFWASRQVCSLRSQLGDRGATLFYGVMGGGIVAYGVWLGLEG